MCSNMGGRGSSSGRGAGGGALKAQAMQGVQQIETLSKFPDLVGNESQIQRANQIRKEFYGTLMHYAQSELDDGSQIGADVAKAFLTGSKNSIATEVVKHAEKLTVGNSSLLQEKLQSTLEAQNNLAQRVGRVQKLFSQKTNAKWWIQNSDGYAAHRMRAYIDGLTGMDNINPMGRLVSKKPRW